MKQFALIVAGGSGTRMKADVPKQFLLLNSRPVLMHTIERFYNFNSSIELVVVLPEYQINNWKELCNIHCFIIAHQLVAGGITRFESVQNGLSVLPNDGIVAIHDGVRPLVSNETLRRCYEKAEECGNALPVMPVIESLRMVNIDENTTVDRSKFVSVQTPQVFNIKDIKRAYKQPYFPMFTDDASVLEKLNIPINLVEGNVENIKVTHPTDLIIAEALLKTT